MVESLKHLAAEGNWHACAEATLLELLRNKSDDQFRLAFFVLRRGAPGVIRDTERLWQLSNYVLRWPFHWYRTHNGFDLGENLPMPEARLELALDGLFAAMETKEGDQLRTLNCAAVGYQTILAEQLARLSAAFRTARTSRPRDSGA